MNQPLRQFLRISGSATIDGVTIFTDLDLTLKPRSWTCLLGASGVGKSTVLRLFAGLAEGVCFTGDLRVPDRVAMMAQQDLLMPWLSVLDNVLLGARLRGARPDTDLAHDRLVQVGLAGHADKRPSALSGGQRQRVALARTLMEDRAVVLLDEPFSALDAMTRAHMQDLTAKLLRGRTVLLVTHDPNEAARLGETIAIMTPTGLIDITAPTTPIPRDLHAADVLRTQATLFDHLRRPA
ncbi:Aliphatic sulfonates import ATP-binding protein SsuB [Ascidiaceihabitans donghaensis]|uniref:Aliphatic sulfonates import ATP-binding protein SsuB n=1 Tax=Ascidiaceihabitans donghaensis TaxID=1510460 RepID=A0A2R8BDK1_9RHOB|nr:ABC transporter ATP-binding protein [Ascidiaceihabitans donghaensis]SPH21092.1 Aliphatic sulfonates import ATP-binding protein SsuB [Ascidiaceihabitans donghaensis]